MVSRAEVLAQRADHAAREVAAAADRLQRVTGGQVDVVVGRAAWATLQVKLAAWRTATARVVQALEASGGQGGRDGRSEG